MKTYYAWSAVNYSKSIVIFLLDDVFPCEDNLTQADCKSITATDCNRYFYYNTKYCCQTCKGLLKKD